MKNNIVKFPRAIKNSEEVSSPFVRVVNWNYVRAKTMREAREAELARVSEERRLRVRTAISSLLLGGALAVALWLGLAW